MTSAGQRTGNKQLQYAESALGDFPTAGHKATEAQLKKADEVLERFVYAMVKASQRQPDGSVVTQDDPQRQFRILDGQ